MPRKPRTPGQGGNELWRALSNAEPKGPPPKFKFRLTPLDVLAMRESFTPDLIQFRGGAGRHGRAK